MITPCEYKGPVINHGKKGGGGNYKMGKLRVETCSTPPLKGLKLFAPHPFSMAKTRMSRHDTT